MNVKIVTCALDGTGTQGDYLFISCLKEVVPTFWDSSILSFTLILVLSTFSMLLDWHSCCCTATLLLTHHSIDKGMEFILDTWPYDRMLCATKITRKDERGWESEEKRVIVIFFNWWIYNLEINTEVLTWSGISSLNLYSRTWNVLLCTYKIWAWKEGRSEFWYSDIYPVIHIKHSYLCPNNNLHNISAKRPLMRWW